jgi:nucleoside-diphosphate-sugar epimerase
MQIFITGASGFVGGAATRELLKQGHHVAAMSRSRESDERILEMGAVPVRCDLESIAAADIGDADICIHSAAFVGTWGPKDAWQQANVMGTRRVLEAAKSAGVSRFIHIGTEAAIVHGQHINGADETCPLALNSPYPYCATKAQAEKLALAANSGNFRTIVLRPRLVWGPGDTTLLPVIESMAAKKQWSWIDHGEAKTSTTYIDNLVYAIVLALTKGTPGQPYFVLDREVHTMKEVISGMAASRGLKLPERNMPYWLADRLAAASEKAWRLLNLKDEPPMTRHAAMVMSHDCVLRDDKARRELGYEPQVSFEEGMRRLQEAAQQTS